MYVAFNSLPSFQQQEEQVRMQFTVEAIEGEGARIQDALKEMD